MSDDEGSDEKELICKRHRKEKKELQDKITGLKKTAGKNKAKKKEVLEEIERLEEELKQKHENELSKFTENDVAKLNANFSLCSVSNSNDVHVNGETNLNNSEVGLRISKAQKRRDKKVQKEKDREKLLKEEEIANEFSERNTESKIIKELLEKRNLQLKTIPSDGDCLFNGISHQLQLKGIERSRDWLRQECANVLRRNCETYLPFISDPNTGDMMTKDAYEKYCSDISNTPMWGGQVELRALSQCLRSRIEIIQSVGPSILIGDEFDKSSSLILTYHRHIYGLGEHYNSVQPLRKQ